MSRFADAGFISLENCPAIAATVGLVILSVKQTFVNVSPIIALNEMPNIAF